MNVQWIEINLYTCGDGRRKHEKHVRKGQANKYSTANVT